VPFLLFTPRRRKLLSPFTNDTWRCFTSECFFSLFHAKNTDASSVVQHWFASAWPSSQIFIVLFEPRLSKQRASNWYHRHVISGTSKTDIKISKRAVRAFWKRYFTRRLMARNLLKVQQIILAFWRKVRRKMVESFVIHHAKVVIRKSERTNAFDLFKRVHLCSRYPGMFTSLRKAWKMAA